MPSFEVQSLGELDASLATTQANIGEVKGIVTSVKSSLEDVRYIVSLPERIESDANILEDQLHGIGALVELFSKIPALKTSATALAKVFDVLGDTVEQVEAKAHAVQERIDASPLVENIDDWIGDLENMEGKFDERIAEVEKLCDPLQKADAGVADVLYYTDTYNELIGNPEAGRITVYDALLGGIDGFLDPITQGVDDVNATYDAMKSVADELTGIVDEQSGIITAVLGLEAKLAEIAAIVDVVRVPFQVASAFLAPIEDALETATGVVDAVVDPIFETIEDTVGLSDLIDDLLERLDIDISAGPLDDLEDLVAGVLDGFDGPDNPLDRLIGEVDAYVDDLDIFGETGIRPPPGSGNDLVFGFGVDDVVDALAGDDMISGGDGDDHLEGGDGLDLLVGGAGNDLLEGGAGGDDAALFAGSFGEYLITRIETTGEIVVDHVAPLDPARSDGVDRLTGIEVLIFDQVAIRADELDRIMTATGAVLEGGDKDDPTAPVRDFLFGNTLANTIYGYGGADFIDGGAGVDTIYGGAGNDVISPGTNGRFETLDGGDGFDTASFTGNSNNAIAHALAVGITFVPTAVPVNVERIQGSDNALDIVWGHDGTDIVFGRGGKDILRGAGGDDELDGGADNDDLFGDRGDDSLRGGTGWDRFFGNVFGDDRIDGGTDADGSDVDMLWYGGIADVPYGPGQRSMDRLLNHTWYDYDGVDTNGNSRLDYGIDYYNGAISPDLADAIVVDMVAGTVEKYLGGTLEGTDTFSNIERIVGSLGDDLLGGADTGDRLDGGAGNDTIIGLGGADILNGGDGNDEIRPGAGADTVDGGAGDDLVLLAPELRMAGDVAVDVASGGSGWDVLDLSESEFRFVVVDRGSSLSLAYPYPIEDSDLLDGPYRATNFSGFEALVGTSGQDDIQLYVGDIEVVHAGAGADFVISYTADVWGEAGDDVIELVVYGAAMSAHGGAGNDRLRAEGAAFLYGDEGNDTMVGSAGAQRFDGGAGKDIVTYGGSAAGVIVHIGYTATGDAEGDSFAGIEGIHGTNLADVLIASAQGMEFAGLRGEDELNGGSGNDLLFGNADDDTVYGGGGDDLLHGGAGSDIVYGAAGIDTASWSFAEAGVERVDKKLILSVVADLSTGTATQSGTVGGSTYNFVDSLAEVENLQGGGMADTLIGDDDDNVLAGGAGDDLISGFGGSDVVVGGAGDDTLAGLAGQDTIVGGSGDDAIFVSADEASLATDTVVATFGNDTIRVEVGLGFSAQYHAILDYGGAGAIVVDAERFEVRETNTIEVPVWENADGLKANGRKDFAGFTDLTPEMVARADKLSIEVYDDKRLMDAILDTDDGSADILALDYEARTVVSTDTFEAVRTIYASDGDDVVYGAGPAAMAAVNAFHMRGGDDFMLGFAASGTPATNIREEFWFGEDGNDSISGGDGVDHLSGGNGEDSLDGGEGDDAIDGGADRDTLDGGAGNDTLDGGSGRDVMDGGAGDDVYFVDEKGDQAFEAADGGTDLVIASSTYRLGGEVENLTLAGPADAGITGIGNRLDNVIEGNAGDNRIKANGGDDTVSGLGGEDRLEGLAGNDILMGGADDDALFGGNGADVCTGGAGDDLLAGGVGNDTLTGGAGADTYRYEGNFGRDDITDFEDGSDRIDLRDLRISNGDAKIGFDQLLLTQRGADTRIALDFDRDGVADEIDLDGNGNTDTVFIDLLGINVSQLDASDFAL